MNTGNENKEGLKTSSNKGRLLSRRQNRKSLPSLTSAVEGRSAFTLIELLVAMSVFSLLIVLLMGMVDGATKLWRENENRVDAYREARAAMGIMAQDLRSAVAGTNTNYFLIDAAALAKFPSQAVQDTNIGNALFFLSALNSNAQNSSSNKSDLCKVGYFLAYGTTSAVPAGASNVNSLNLYRYLQSSDQTYSDLVAAGTASSPFPNVTTVTDVNTDLLARNIKAFRVSAFTRQTNGTLVTFTPGTNSALPDLVEISVTALNRDTAEKLRSVSDWTGPSGGITNVIKQVEQTFTTRIHLVNKP